ELYLGGTQLADGYINRPDLTATRFIADPTGSGEQSGQRLYRTGDLVRWNHDGQLDYLGRTDDQVKIRGFRIELDEIRVVLEQHPTITTAIVIAAEHPGGTGKYLAAYHTGDSIDPDELRAFLTDRLPDYMIPTVFIPITTVPVTPNGKLDRRALPAPDLTSALAGGSAPATATEFTLAGIFSDVLGLPSDAPLSIDDDFFRLGGHSLTATRVAARINAELGTCLTLREVFTTPTITGLAHLVDTTIATLDTTGDGATGHLSPVRITDIEVTDPIPASYGQQALWIIDQLGGPASQYVVPTIWTLTGNLDTAAFTAAIGDLVTRHHPLRTLLVEHDGTLTQHIVEPTHITERLSIEITDLRESGPVDARIDDIIAAGFDLATDLPLRVAVLRTGDTEWTIALIAHHHAIDEWSTPALLTDLAAAYTARQAGTAPTWTPLPVTYAHYATWQRTTLGDAADPTSELSRHLDYWRTTLTDAPDESIITLDHPRPAHPTGHGTDITFTIDPHTAAAARTVAAHCGVSMFTLTHTVTAITASLLGAGTDIVIGSPVGGRTEHGLENLIGYFVNTLPLRHHLHPTDTITDLLTTTHHTILDGLAHQHAPFETITRTTNTPRTTNRTPLFQILLTHNSTD
ncbi:hypothetical protein CH267_06930, partial [Rhodococcus sp. 06-621-2]